MHPISISQARIRNGAWHAVVVSPAEADPPSLTVQHGGKRLSGVEVKPEGEVEGLWLVRVPIPREVISDGVQTFVVCEEASGEVLDRFTLMTGKAAEPDLRAEVDLLRAELDLLKSAFRRHCADTEGPASG